MAITETKIVTLFDDAGKTIAFAPRTKISAISDDNGAELQSILNGKLALAGGTMTGHITFAGGTTQSTIKGLKWNSISSKNPYIGYATDQTDGTFVVSSLLGTNYASGLAIGGGSGNLLYKGAVVLHADNWSNYAAAASHNHSASNITSGTLPIGRGGTGAADAINARNNLLYLGPNPITSTANDTTAKWGAYGPGTLSFYSATGQLIDQPAQWGLLLTLSAGIGAEVHQIWTTQSSGNLLHRGGNASGWNGTWRTILDSSNYSSYALPLSGGSLSGGLTAPIFGATQHMTISAGLVQSMVDGQSRWFGNGIAFSNPTTKNDQGWLRVTGTGEADTVFEIATGDDGGAGETIAVRQYNTSNTISRELILLNTSGNTTFPGSVYKRGQNVPSTFVQSGQPTGTFQTGDIWFVT